MKKVVVGMSGGIDSFAAALLLQEKGFEVIGVTLELWEKNEISSIQQICRTLGIPLLRRDGRELFREVVVRDFVESYLSGRTPSPCCICNGFVKWQLLKQQAEECQAGYVATGHYVNIHEQGGKYYIRKGKDARKDQSYFLWRLPQEVLARALTPLGDMTKEEVKNWVTARGYPEIVRRKESMGICFLAGQDYRGFIRQYRSYQQESGPILDRGGRVIGEHTGLLNYTIGQKRGIPVINSEPLYVAEMDVNRNRIVADVKQGLNVTAFEIEQAVWVSAEDRYAADVTVRVRGFGLNPDGFAKIEKSGDDCYQVILSQPAWAVAPGQPVAFYRKDLLVGGGIVK